LALCAALIALALVAGCASGGSSGAPAQQGSTTATGSAPSTSAAEATQPPAFPWLDDGLVDVTSTSKFTIADYAGRPVVLHFFSASSKEAKKQQKVLNELPLEEDRGPVVVAIDVDSKEDPTLVINAVSERGNQGHYIYASDELRDALVKQFGDTITDRKATSLAILNAKQTEATLQPAGIMQIDALNAALAQAAQ
jgi:hypothetical protein